MPVGYFDEKLFYISIAQGYRLFIFPCYAFFNISITKGWSMFYLVCQKQIQLDWQRSYTIQSPEFPLSYHAGMRCTWNISKDGLQSSWFKISVLEDSQNCLTSFQMDFKDELCSKENKNKSIVLIDDAMFVTFYSRSTGLASSILVEGNKNL